MLGILGSGFVSPSELNMARVSQYVSSRPSKIQSKIREPSQQRLRDPFQLQCDTFASNAVSCIGGSLKLLHCDSVCNCDAFQCNSIFSQFSIPIATFGSELPRPSRCDSLYQFEAHWAVPILALRIWGWFAQFQLCMWTFAAKAEIIWKKSRRKDS